MKKKTLRLLLKYCDKVARLEVLCEEQQKTIDSLRRTISDFKQHKVQKDVERAFSL